jgi:hypothetical protein
VPNVCPTGTDVTVSMRAEMARTVRKIRSSDEGLSVSTTRVRSPARTNGFRS